MRSGALTVVAVGLIASASLAARQTPVRRAVYTPVFTDNIEVVQPALGPAFSLLAAGAITQTPGEVIAGARSIRGTHTGPGSFSAYLRTLTAQLPLTPLQSYRVTFQYRILTTPSAGFECLFFSPTGAGQGSFLPSLTISGVAGDSGTGTLTNTLGPFNDYEARWTVVGTGSIAIDNIQIVAMPAQQPIAAETAEGSAPTIGAGLRLSGAAVVTTDPGQIIAGSASVRLGPGFGAVTTDATAVPLGPDTYYVVEVSYRIVTRTAGDQNLFVEFRPATATDGSASVWSGRLLRNAETTGTFSTGALLPSASGYTVRFATPSDSVVVVDNITLIRLDPQPLAAPPPAWATLESLPFPRLGNYSLCSTDCLVQAPYEGAPYTNTQTQIEDRLARFDVVVGTAISAQTRDSAFVRRLRQRNPTIVVLPYRIAQEQVMDPSAPAPPGATIDLQWTFRQGVANEWIAKRVDGSVVPDSTPEYAFIRKMNISDFSPVVGGHRFPSYLLNWIAGPVLGAGLWDGVFFDNLFGRINPHIPNYWNPALLDYDLNLNGTRDESPALGSAITRAAAKQFMRSIRQNAGDLALFVGNTGPMPELPLAPYVNGYTFECVNRRWDRPSWSMSGFSEAEWRHVLDQYFRMQRAVRAPRLNILEGCSLQTTGVPTADDVHDQRFVLATALLGDGFAEYDLYEGRSRPSWFDEYSVNGAGVAVESAQFKGYLGQPLGPAIEMATPSSLLWVENFESGQMPVILQPSHPARTYVTSAPQDVVDGAAGLVIDVAEHSQMQSTTVSTISGALPFVTGETYVIEFDWRVLDTLDDHLEVEIENAGGDKYSVRGVVTGDSGRARFPITIQTAGSHRLRFVLQSGGRIAIDNVRVTQGGAGPWRRDFEHGVVLINPIKKPYTFNATELAGAFGRTNLRRILGTQDPAVNNGQAVGGSLTLADEDAIILLAGCGAGISPVSADFAAAGGSGNVNVAAPGGCSWTASSSSPALTVTSGASGSGNGTVTYDVAANPSGSARVLTVTVAGRAVRVTQAGAASNIVQNGTFGAGLSNWIQFATPDLSYIVASIVDGALEFYRVPPPPGTANQAVVFQNTGAAVVANGALTAQFELGNTSTARKRISVLLHESDFSDLFVCTFWLAPNAPIRPYQMLTHTTKFWNNLTVSFYAASAGSDGGGYRIDNVSIQHNPAAPSDQTTCVDPTAPTAPGGASSTNLIGNGNFEGGPLAPWGLFGRILSRVEDGVFEFYRPSGTPAGVVLQGSGTAVSSGHILTAAFSLGNNSPVRKRVTLLLHDGDFSDLTACTFWIPPGQPLLPYAMRGFTTKPWANATISFYAATVGLDEWIRLDDVALTRTPGTATQGTECIEPGGSLSLLTVSSVAPPVPVVVTPGGVISVTEISDAGKTIGPVDLTQSLTSRLSVPTAVVGSALAVRIQISIDGRNWRTVAFVTRDDGFQWDLDLSEWAGQVIYIRLTPIGGRLRR